MESETTKSELSSPTAKPPAAETSKRTAKGTALLFLGGLSAGLITFLVFGGIWQVNHFWWVLAAVSLTSGALAVAFRKNFQAMLRALLDDAPSI